MSSQYKAHDNHMKDHYHFIVRKKNLNRNVSAITLNNNRINVPIQRQRLLDCIKNDVLIESILSPGQCGSMGWAPACKPKGC